MVAKDKVCNLIFIFKFFSYAFRLRIEMKCDRCKGEYPPEIRISDTHVVSCYRFLESGEVLGYPKSVNVEEL